MRLHGDAAGYGAGQNPTVDESASCQQAKGPTMTLSMTEVGRSVRLQAIDAGRGLRARLAAMGLVPGVQMQVISNDRHGAFVIGLKDARVVLGRGMAHKITVE